MINQMASLKVVLWVFRLVVLLVSQLAAQLVTKLVLVHKWARQCLN